MEPDGKARRTVHLSGGGRRVRHGLRRRGEAGDRNLKGRSGRSGTDSGVPEPGEGTRPQVPVEPPLDLGRRGLGVGASKPPVHGGRG